MNKILFRLLSILIFNTSFSQEVQLFKSKDKLSYKIEGHITGLQDTSVILAYYFGGKQYASDTAFSKSGKVVFSGEKELSGGMYMVVLPNQQYFDIVISEQKFSFSTNINSLVKSMKFTNSKENTPFYKYLNFITDKQREVTPLREKEKTASDDEKKTYSRKNTKY